MRNCFFFQFRLSSIKMSPITGLVNHLNIILLLSTSLIDWTVSQNILPDNLDNQCTIKMKSALITCEGNLQDRLDLTIKPTEYQINGANCCYLAEFTHCVETLTQEMCSKQLNDLYSSNNFTITTTNIQKCSSYSLYGVTCTMLIHIAYIIAAAVILGLITIVSCVIGYRRWRMLKTEAKQTMNPFNRY